MRSSRWALIQPDCGPYKKRQLGHRHRHWEKHVRTRGKMAICKPRREARGESTLPTPWPHLLASGTVRNVCPSVGPTGQGCGQGPKTSPTRTFFLDLMSSRCRGMFLPPAVFLASVNSSLSPLLITDHSTSCAGSLVSQSSTLAPLLVSLHPTPRWSPPKSTVCSGSEKSKLETCPTSHIRSMGKFLQFYVLRYLLSPWLQA